ncbi:MAG TPA: response regulator [Waterburya sp.]
MNNFPAFDGLRVLLVDDNIDNLELLAIILEQYGTEVITAASAAEAIQAIAQSIPDILISDIAMPLEDGYSLIRQIRKLPPEQGGLIPAIALTAYAKNEDRLLALEAGFQMHLPKPIDPDELIAVVMKLVQQS